MEASRLAQSSRWRRVTHLGVAMTLGILCLVAWMWGLREVASVHAGPATRYVYRATGSDTTDCTNPVGPCATIGYALDRAGDGDTILIATGTYTENLVITKTITLKGGYEPVAWSRCLRGCVTTIDGNLSGRVIEVQSTLSETTVIDGFIITNGDGGIDILLSSVAILNSQIVHNHSTGGGGGIRIDHSPVIITNTVIADNTADLWDGAVRIISTIAIAGPNSEVTINSSTIANNRAPKRNGVFCSLSWCKAVNSVVWGHVGEDFAGLGYEATYSDIEMGLAGEGNISADPRFVDPADGDYHLRLDSPCIDRGTNANAPQRDFEGDRRPFDTGSTGAAVVDMGADETVAVLLFRDEFDGSELDPAKWDVIQGIPTVGDGKLTLPGDTTRAEIQSKAQFQYGVLQVAIESSDWVSQTQGTDSSFGFEIWTGANGQCHYGVILIANGHLGILRSQPDADNNCFGDPLHQAYLPISNWDSVRAAGRVYLTLTWSPGGVTLYVSDGSSNSGLASYTDEAEPAIPLEIRLNADVGEIYHVDYVRVYRDLAALSYNPSHFPVHRPDLDWDRDVDLTDIMIVADVWHAERGEPQYRQYYDLYHDGKINVVDVMRVASHWGETFNLGPHFPLAYSPYRPGQAPGGSPPSPPEIGEDMETIAQETKLIRTYGACDEELAAIPGIANSHGIHLYQGVELDSTPLSNDQEMACFAGLVAEHENIVAGVIGNETLQFDRLPESDLVAYLKQAKGISNVPVTTGEPWNVWCNEPQADPPCQGRAALGDEVDFILAHSYPYWEVPPVPIEHGAAHVVATYIALRALYPDQVVAIGETGWPTCGAARDNAVPGLENQQRFIEELWRWSNLYHIPVFFFEAFDEDWKIAEPGGVGPCWGLYYADRTPKHDNLDWSIPIPEPTPTTPAVRIEHPRNITTTVTKSNCGIPIFGRVYNAEPGWHVKVEVFTNQWYVQDKWYPAGLAPIIDDMWSMPEVVLGGADEYNNHSIRATLVDETGAEVDRDEVAGIMRTNPCSP